MMRDHSLDATPALHVDVSGPFACGKGKDGSNVYRRFVGVLNRMDSSVGILRGKGTFRTYGRRSGHPCNGAWFVGWSVHVVRWMVGDIDGRDRVMWFFPVARSSTPDRPRRDDDRTKDKCRREERLGGPGAGFLG